MSGILLPPGARARRERLPEGDVRLPDGRLLKRFGVELEAEVAPGVIQRQRAWQCPPISLRVIGSDEQTPHGLLLHVSLSHPNKLPTWEEVTMVRDAFFGADIDVMMVLPQAADYVNAHPYVFHLWQTPTTWGMR
jgi:hypothetical protein